jgi:hypothetical protein
VNSATIFHSEEWMQVLEETYGFERVSGGPLPLMEANSLLGGKRGVSLPFTDECPPVVSSREEFGKAWNGALELGRDRNWKYLEVRGGKEWLPEAPASLRFYRHTLDLTGGEEALFGLLDGSVRQAIRKAEKTGVKVERAQGLEGMRTYYRLHCRTRKKHGLPPQPWSFFLNIQRHLMSKGLGVLVLARIDQIALAGAVFFYGKDAVYKFGASDESRQQARGNNLVMWEGIRWLAAQGCERLDFGRTSLENEGLRRFKAGWGSREGLIEYVKYDVRGSRFMVDKDRASGWHNQIFSRMPMALLRAAGAVLYRQMT